MPAGEIDITNDENVTITANVDGTTTIEIEVAQGLRGGNLQNLEGGNLRIKVKTDETLPTFLILTNRVEGYFENQFN